MKEYAIAAASILAVLGVGFVFLIKFGVTSTVYFGLAMIALAIILSVVYIVRKTRIKYTETELKIKILVKIRNDYQKAYQLIERAGEMADMDPVMRELDTLRDKLTGLRCFNIDINIMEEVIDDYTLTFIEQEKRKVEEKLRNIDATAVDIYGPKLGEYTNDLKMKLSKLQEVGYNIAKDINAFEELSNKEVKNLEGTIQKKDDLSRRFVSILDFCTEEASKLTKTAGLYDAVDGIEQWISGAREDKDGLESVRLLVKARTKLKGILKREFNPKRSALISSIDKIMPLLDSAHVPESIKDDFKNMRERVHSTKDPGQFEELQNIHGEYTNMVAGSVSTLYDTLAELEAKTSLHKLPKKLWTVDEKIPPLVDDVDVKLDVVNFTKKATFALKRILSQFDRDVLMIKILKNYNRVEQIISKNLRKRKRITTKDLKAVSYPEKFLLLYSLNHPETEFIDDPPTLELTKRSL